MAEIQARVNELLVQAKSLEDGMHKAEDNLHRVEETAKSVHAKIRKSRENV